MKGWPTTFALREIGVLESDGGFSHPVDVVVHNGVIVAVEQNSARKVERSFDFAGSWLIPGIVDCHSHLALSSTDALESLRRPITLWALEAADNARRTVEAGVTFVRDAGGTDSGIRTAIEKGYVKGPRLQVAVTALCQTGGHLDGFLTGPGFEIATEYLMPNYPGRPPYRVDGVDEMRRAVRTLVRARADWIKLCVTGGVFSEFDEPDRAEFTREEIETATSEAARAGKEVMVHAFGGTGLTDAVRAGARSVEHGLFLTEEQASLMAQRGCWLVPTLSVVRDVIHRAEQGQLPDFAARKALSVQERFGDAVKTAREYGVKMAVGSDSFERGRHGKNLEEVALLRSAGLRAEEALLAGTANGAELCGVADRIGRISPGYVFDAIVFDTDPLDTDVFLDAGAVRGVFKAGFPTKVHERVEGMSLGDAQRGREWQMAEPR